MFLDGSALLAIYFGGPDAEPLGATLGQDAERRDSFGTWLGGQIATQPPWRRCGADGCLEAESRVTAARRWAVFALGGGRGRAAKCSERRRGRGPRGTVEASSVVARIWGAVLLARILVARVGPEYLVIADHEMAATRIFAQPDRRFQGQALLPDSHGPVRRCVSMQVEVDSAATAARAAEHGAATNPAPAD